MDAHKTQLDAKIQDLETKFNLQAIQISNLQTDIRAKDKEIAQLTSIIVDLRTEITDQTVLIGQVVQTLKTITDFLKK
jgi:hypothetical protein